MKLTNINKNDDYIKSFKNKKYITDNNKDMNQILATKLKNEKYIKRNVKKKIFKIQILVSIVVIFWLYGKTLLDNYNRYELEKITKSIEKNLKVSEIYNVEKQSKEQELYFGKISIPKINLEYTIFNNFSEELMKISPCKFYGVGIGEKGNICIAGHNYNDKRFFGRLFELEKNDIIKLSTLDNKTYIYKIYDIYEANENDLSCLENNKKYELTLVTCNNTNKKRRIIKAVYNEFIDFNK